MKTITLCLSAAGFLLNNLWAENSTSAETALGVGQVARNDEKRGFPSSAPLFNEFVGKLVQDVNSSGSKVALGKLQLLDQELITNDSGKLRMLFLEKLKGVDPKVIGVFEESLLLRYYELMGNPESLSDVNESEVGMIAVVGRSAISVKLAKLFRRDATKVKPYLFSEKALRYRGAWRRPDVDDWKGLQGRLISASIACDDLEILKDWIGLAESSPENLRLLIWWGLGYSLREEAMNYLLEKRSKQLTPDEQFIVECALSFASERISTLSNRLESHRDDRFGALTLIETQALGDRLRHLAPLIEQRLKATGAFRQSSSLVYRE